MSTFSVYMKFEHIAIKARWRLDSTLSFSSHSFFEERRKTKARRETAFRDAILQGALIMSYGKTDRIDADGKRKADYCLSIGKDHFTSIYPYGEVGFSYGDIPHTDDVVIFKDDLQITTEGIVGGSLEIWVAKGMLKEESNLLQMVEEGVFDEELERLREQATIEPHLQKEETIY